MQVELHLSEAEKKILGDEWEVVEVRTTRPGDNYLGAGGVTYVSANGPFKASRIIVRRRKLSPDVPPPPDGEYWTECSSGQCPVDHDVPLLVQYRDGVIATVKKAADVRWTRLGKNGDIIRCRLQKPTKPPGLWSRLESAACPGPSDSKFDVQLYDGSIIYGIRGGDCIWCWPARASTHIARYRVAEEEVYRKYNEDELYQLWRDSAKLVVKGKRSGGTVSGFDVDGVVVSGFGWRVAQELLDNWEHVDGGVCGVKEVRK